MKSDSLFNSKRILVLLLLILAGGAIYELPLWQTRQKRLVFYMRTYLPANLRENSKSWQ